ncbi:MAG: protein-glutamate O-methyltransferase CheR [Rhodocyclaceae bacterium]|nr:MAG: protein-glutamate O-methyltransferase CheR [Rhodocyclaceae bacterium]
MNDVAQTRNAHETTLAQSGSLSGLYPMTGIAGSSQRIEDVVRRTTGLQVRERDMAALSRWAAERARALALPTIERYGELLAEDSAVARRERELLTVKFTTGESYFFRDLGQFDLLAAKILPELIERRASKRKLRIWSAGCSTGEEAYSLAMLVDAMTPSLEGWEVLILGTDINSAALEKARRRVYREWSFRALDAERKQRYFDVHGDHWMIKESLRGRVDFRCLDLMGGRFPDPEAGLNEFDLILCRNVFIYLDVSAVSRITAKFAATLADDGYLLTGHNELFAHEVAPLRVRMFPQSAVFQKTSRAAVITGLGEALATIPVPVVAALPPPAIKPPAPRAASQGKPSPPPALPVERCDRLMQIAWREADSGMPDEASRSCREVIAINSLDPRPYFLLAQLAQERGDVPEAKILLNKVIYLDQTFVAAYLELGNLLAQSGDDTRARHMYKTVRTALERLPPQTVIAPYAESTATDILAYVDRLLGEQGGEAAAITAKNRPRRGS